MRWCRCLLAGVPALLGLAAGLLIEWSRLPDPVFYMRSDLATLIFLLGLLISGMWAVVLGVRARTTKDRLQDELAAAQDRRRFLSRLDHELKNPLTAILAGLANLSGGAGEQDAEWQPDALRSVESQVKRLSRLVADLRKLSDLETRPLDFAPVEMDGLMEDVFSLAQESQEAQDRQLSLSIPHAPWPLPQISGDSDLLFLALHNLLGNALKFTRPGDTIEMRVSEDGSQVVIEVADTGPGIPEDELPYVWQELYRGKAARGTPGSGLGLALVRAIVHRHGGEISLRSRLEQGTIFTVRLPAGDVTRS